MEKRCTIIGAILILTMTSALCNLRTITAQPENFVFIHLSDVHIGNPNSETRLQAAINEINSMNPLPAFVVITGDLTNDGTLVEYAILKNTVDQFNVPVHLVRGNHDGYGDQNGMYFREYFGNLYYSFDYGFHHFVMLDSSNGLNAYGHISAEQLTWLSGDLALAGTEKPTFLFLHHMVFGWENLGWEIDRGIDNGQLLKELIYGYNIEGIFVGHVHANTEIYYDGLTQMSTCSVWYNYETEITGPEGYGIIHVSNSEMAYDFKILGGNLVHRSYERVVADVDFWANGTTTTPTINGVLSPSEWDDAWKIAETSPVGYEWKVYVKQNRKYLYVAWDVSDASVHGGDNVLIQMDYNDDGVYDCLSSIYRNGTVFDYPLDNKPGVPFAGHAVTSGPNGYRVEASMSLSDIGRPDAEDIIRMVLATEDGYAHIRDDWPDNAGQNPEFWARMVSSNGWETASLVGLWHFDEGTGTEAYDSSSYSNNGTVNGALWVDGVAGKALSFDGVDDYVNVTEVEVLRIFADVTVEAWIKPNDVSGLNLVVAQSEVDTAVENNWLYSVLIRDGRVEYYHEYGNVSRVWIVTDSPIVSAGEWYKITVVRDATLNVVKIYVNETLVKSGSYTEPPTGGSSTSLYVGGMNSAYSFDGTIDEVHIWDEVRSYDPLVGLWHFDEGSGTIANDSSGYGNDGTVSGAAWVLGRYGSALDLDGVGGRVNVGHDVSLNTNVSMTLEAWIKRDSIGTKQAIIGRRTSVNSWTYFVRFHDNNTIFFAVSKTGDDTGYTALTTANTYTDTLNWHHVAVTYRYVTDGTSVMRIYYDGALAAETNSAVGPIVSDTARDVWIGAREQPGDNQWFNGSIDEVQIWKEERTAEQIRKDAVPEPLVGYWRFDEGLGTTANDSSEYHNNAKVSGATWVIGRYAKALHFDGVDDRVVAKASVSLNTMFGMTLEAWVRRDSIGTRQVIIGRRTSVDSWTYFLRFQEDNTIFFAISKTGNDTSYTSLKTTAAYTDTTNWHHIAATYKYVADGTSIMRIYYDGSLAAETTSAVGPIVSDTARDVWIGARAEAGSEHWLNGTIDEVKIWNEPRYPAPSPLVGFWRFDEGTGTTAYDSSGYGNDGTLLPQTQGAFGGALKFNGVDNRVNVGHGASLNTMYNMTLEAWVKRGSIGASHVIIGRRTAATGWTYFLRFNSDNTITFAISKTGDDTGFTALVTASTYTDTTNWHHIAATYKYVADGTSIMRIYYDGSLAAETTSAVGPIVSDTARDVWIGARGQTGSEQWFNGSIDEVRISNIPRTSFSLTLPPSVDADTVGLWHFNEETGSTAYDASVNNNHGTVTGATWLLAGPIWITSGKYNGALTFDGVNDYVRVPDSNSLDVTSKMTLEAWIYPHTVGKDYQVIVHKHNHTDNNRSYYLGLQLDKLAFYLSPDGVTNYILISATSIAVNVWTHVTATSDGTTMKLFINEVQDPNTIAAPSTIHANSYPLIIGAYLPDVTGYQRCFDGVIDEVAVFNEVRSVHDVAVTSVTTWKTAVGEGTNCSIQLYVVVENHGEYPETFDVSLYSDSSSIENQTVSSLNSKDFAILTFTWNTTGFTKGNYTISAYAWPVLAETHTDDNTFTNGVVKITIPGDVDGNFKVDMGDISALCDGFGSSIGPDGWYWHKPPCIVCPHSPNCDTDGNGQMDMGDIIAACDNFGKTYP